MTQLSELERRLWAAADALRANSSLTPAEYRGPVLGLIFLAFAEHRFDELRPELELKATERRPVSADDFRARGVLFVPEIARLSWLVDLPEGEDLGANIDLAMDAIEATNTGLRGVLPRGYQKLEKSVLLELVRLFAPLPRMVSGDAFGLIYEYFLAEFAANEGRRGGEFLTPQSIVRLIVDVIEPFRGRVYDPACGSGGMFVHSARFVANHSGSPARDLAVYGQEQKEGTVPLGRMNLALHGLSGDIRLANANGEVAREARRRLMLAFNTPFFPEILIASAVMSEGVDLHLDCRYVVHHDLDWNPSVLEQRTGRVDRLGSKSELSGRPIHVYEPFLEATQDEKQFLVVKDRERWFNVVMGEKLELDEWTTDRLAERVELPAEAAAELALRLEVVRR